MAWFRLEGRGAFHHKVVLAGDEAYGAWVRAGQWSSDQLTDGFIPRAMALQINRKPKVWAKLVEARLLHEEEGGYRIHDFLDWNPASDEERARREAMREKRREAGREGGLRSGKVRRGEGAKPNDSDDLPKQDGSNGEANAKQSASGLLEANTKQNEAPNPNPNPRDQKNMSPPAAPTPAVVPFVPADAPPAVADPPPAQATIPGLDTAATTPPAAPAVKPKRERPPSPPTPATEVRDAWSAEWLASGMVGPAPWGKEDMIATGQYLAAPGATVDTARLAFLGMLRTPAGDWHRTHEGGRHATARAALLGANAVAFTSAGKAWREAQEYATRPRKIPPPPRPIPDFVAIKARQEADRERIARLRSGLPPLPPPTPPAPHAQET